MKLGLATAVIFLGTTVLQDKTALRTALKDTDVHAGWVYDDLAAGYSEAKKTNKPMMVVFRCVP